MLAPMILLFTIIPAIEIYLLFQIGGEIGGLNTIMIIILTGIIGATLAKSQGLSILMQIQNEMNSGAIPTNQIIHGLMVFAGGLLLLTPGFLTDVIGFCLVVPGSRHILIIWVRKFIEKAMKNGNVNFQFFAAQSSGGFQQHQSHGSYPDREKQNEQVAPGVFEADYTTKDE